MPDQGRDPPRRFTYEHQEYPGFDLWVELAPDRDGIDIVLDYGSDEDPDDPTSKMLQDRVELTLDELAWVAKMAPRLFDDEHRSS